MSFTRGGLGQGAAAAKECTSCIHSMGTAAAMPRLCSPPTACQHGCRNGQTLCFMCVCQQVVYSHQSLRCWDRVHVRSTDCSHRHQVTVTLQAEGHTAYFGAMRKNFSLSAPFVMVISFSKYITPTATGTSWPLPFDAAHLSQSVCAVRVQIVQ